MSGAQPPAGPVPFATGFSLTDFVQALQVTSDGAGYTATMVSGQQLLAALAAGLSGVAAGTRILNGAAAPGPSVGNNGDYYLMAGATLFGPKANGAWPGSGTPLGGPKGDPGDPGDKGDPGDPGNNGSVSAAPTITDMAPSDFIGVSRGGQDYKIALVNAVLQSGAAGSAASGSAPPGLIQNPRLFTGSYVVPAGYNAILAGPVDGAPGSSISGFPGSSLKILV